VFISPRLHTLPSLLLVLLVLLVLLLPPSPPLPPPPPPPLAPPLTPLLLLGLKKRDCRLCGDVRPSGPRLTRTRTIDLKETTGRNLWAYANESALRSIPRGVAISCERALRGEKQLELGDTRKASCALGGVRGGGVPRRPKLEVEADSQAKLSASFDQARNDPQ